MATDKTEEILIEFSSPLHRLCPSRLRIIPSITANFLEFHTVLLTAERREPTLPPMARKTRGATITELALLLGGITIAAVPAISLFGDKAPELIMCSIREAGAQGTTGWDIEDMGQGFADPNHLQGCAGQRSVQGSGGSGGGGDGDANLAAATGGGGFPPGPDGQQLM